MQLASNRSNQNITPDVKLSIPIQKWVDILLDQAGFAFFFQLFYSLYNISPTLYYCNSLTSIRILPRLDNKKAILIKYIISKDLLQFNTQILLVF